MAPVRSWRQCRAFAHRGRWRARVHAHGAAGIKVAIRAGVDTVEHADVRVMEKVSFVMKGGEIYER